MRSIGFRIAFWYALASVLTLTCFFRVGRYLVEQHMVHSLDTGIAAEFESLKRRLTTDTGPVAPEEIGARLRASASVRYYIDIHQPDGRLTYRSRNLAERVVPDVPMQRHFLSVLIDRMFEFFKIAITAPTAPARRNYNALVGDLGEMRIGEFLFADQTVRVAVSKEQVRSMVEAYEEVFYGMVALMIIASSVIGFFLSHILLRPLRQIQATAAHIGSDNLSERIPVSSVDDEVSDLARLLNQMFGRLEKSFAQTRQFAAEASHELKTPLSLMRLQTEKLLLEGGLSPTQEDSLHVVVEEITRLNKFIEELLFVSRAEAEAVNLDLKPQDPRAYMEGFFQDARVLADSRGIKLEDVQSGQGVVELNARWLRNVLLNLLTNALNYTPAGKRVIITSQFTPTTWRVAVEDEGPGVPAEQRERIFERYVRLASPTEQHKGNGLGLAICRSIVTLHHGRIWAEAAPAGPGLRIVFELPLAAAEPAATPA